MSNLTAVVPQAQVVMTPRPVAVPNLQPQPLRAAVNVGQFPPLPEYNLQLPNCHVAVGDVILTPDIADTPAERYGITRNILQQAGKETRDRLTSELTVMMSVCTFIGGFLFSTLVSGTAATSAARTPAHNAYVVFAGVTVILALTCVGVYARLLVLLQWSATSSSLYRTICRWERAMSGNQLIFYSIINTAIAAALAACWDYQVVNRWVFAVLTSVAGFVMVCFTYFWSESMWCSTHGIMHIHTKLFYKRLLNVADGDVYQETWHMYPSGLHVDNVRHTFYGIVDQYLMNQAY
jgi:hypothetical protein